MDVDFGATSDTYSKTWGGKLDKFLYELYDQFPGRRHPKTVRTLVKRVEDNIDWAVIASCERFLQNLYQHVVGRLVCAIIVSHVLAVEY